MPDAAAPDYFREPERLADTRRAREIARLHAYYQGTQYDGRPDFFNGAPAGGGEPVPVRERKPCIIYPLPRAACNQATRFTFGEGRFPQVAAAETTSDDATTAVSADEAKLLTGYLAHVIELSRVKSAMRRLLRIGLSRRSAVVVLGVRRGRFVLDMPSPEHCSVEFVDGDPEGEVVRMVWCYQFQKDVQRGKTVVSETYYFRRDYTDTEVVFYEDAPSIPGKAAEWVRDETRSRKHGLGFCPVRWIRNLPAEDCQDVDGVALCDGLEDELDTLNFTLSQRHRGIVYFGSPQAWEAGVGEDEQPGAVGRTERPAKTTTAPAGAKDGYQKAGGARARKKAPDEIWSYRSVDAKVEIMETTGVAFEVASKHVLDVRARILEAIDVVLLDPMTVAGKGELSAKALAMMYAPLLAFVDELRDCWWSTGLAPILSMILRITMALSGKGILVPQAAAVAAICKRFLVDLGDELLWVAPKLLPSWGNYFSPTNAEIGELVDATNAAKEGGLIKTATAKRNVQPYFGETDTDDEDDEAPESRPPRPTSAGGASEDNAMDVLHMDCRDDGRRLALPAEMLATLRVRQLGAVAEHAVWAVDGAAVRLLDLEFADGGNPSRYVYIPDGEIWIEQRITDAPADLAATILHELVECEVMEGDVGYASAHLAAIAMEEMFRKACAVGAARATTVAEALAVVTAWYPGLLAGAEGLAAAHAAHTAGPPPSPALDAAGEPDLQRAPVGGAPPPRARPGRARADRPTTTRP